jgi:hypothetical protein
MTFPQPVLPFLPAAAAAVETHWYSENPALSTMGCKAVVKTVYPDRLTFFSLCEYGGNDDDANM